MDTQTHTHAHGHAHNRNRAIVFLLLAFVAPFVVLLLPGMAESCVRAAYAVCLGVVVAVGGAWVAFRANADELAKRWTPDRFKPAWAVFMRLAGMFVIVAGVILLTSTVQDVVEFLSSGRPHTFIATARRVEGKLIIHPVFQTVSLREGKHYPTNYMFAYGGKRLVEGQQYAVTVLPRSKWILSAHEDNKTANQQ